MTARSKALRGVLIARSGADGWDNTAMTLLNCSVLAIKVLIGIRTSFPKIAVNKGNVGLTDDQSG
jgi:hypothetical protein